MARVEQANRHPNEVSVFLTIIAVVLLFLLPLLLRLHFEELDQVPHELIDVVGAVKGLELLKQLVVCKILALPRTFALIQMGQGCSHGTGKAEILRLGVRKPRLQPQSAGLAPLELLHLGIYAAPIQYYSTFASSVGAITVVG